MSFRALNDQTFCVVAIRDRTLRFAMRSSRLRRLGQLASAEDNLFSDGTEGLKFHAVHYENATCLALDAAHLAAVRMPLFSCGDH